MQATLLHLQVITLKVAKAQLFFFNDTATTEIYTHASASAQRDAVNLLEDQLFPNVPKLESCGNIAEKESQLVQLSKLVVGAPGFEPGTSCAQGRRATRLRYAPT